MNARLLLACAVAAISSCRSCSLAPATPATPPAVQSAPFEPAPPWNVLAAEFPPVGSLDEVPTEPPHILSFEQHQLITSTLTQLGISFPGPRFPWLDQAGPDVCPIRAVARVPTRSGELLVVEDVSCRTARSLLSITSKGLVDAIVTLGSRTKLDANGVVETEHRRTYHLDAAELGLGPVEWLIVQRNKLNAEGRFEELPETWRPWGRYVDEVTSERLVVVNEERPRVLYGVKQRRYRELDLEGDPARGAVTAVFPGSKQVYRLVFSPDGKSLTSTGPAGAVQRFSRDDSADAPLAALPFRPFPSTIAWGFTPSDCPLFAGWACGNPLGRVRFIDASRFVLSCFDYDGTFIDAEGTWQMSEQSESRWVLVLNGKGHRLADEESPLDFWGQLELERGDTGFRAAFKHTEATSSERQPICADFAVSPVSYLPR